MIQREWQIQTFKFGSNPFPFFANDGKQNAAEWTWEKKKKSMVQFFTRHSHTESNRKMKEEACLWVVKLQGFGSNSKTPVWVDGIDRVFEVNFGSLSRTEQETDYPTDKTKQNDATFIRFSCFLERLTRIIDQKKWFEWKRE